MRERGVVVFYPCEARCHPRGHERVTQRKVAEALARLKGWAFAGDYDAADPPDEAVYFVPSDTLAPLEAAHRLGIRGERDLFGGVVPHPFMATKTITHALPDADAAAPEGWTSGFAQQVQSVVLPGCSAFTLPDARRAGLRLLLDGAVRLKPACSSGGAGQSVVRDAAELQAGLVALDQAGQLRQGLVLERDLAFVRTYSVGQVHVDALQACYFGIQRLAANNRGEMVYGGSDLTVARGGFEALLRLPCPPEILTAVAQARRYHAAALATFAGMFASRCNYDVAQGIDESGRWHSGVLEQSWRIGGASGAEVAALQAFRDDPALQVVRASTTEVYGPDPVVPPDACLYYSGDDAQLGPLTKYARLEPHADTR